MLLPELATYLQSAGIGTLGTDLFYGRVPASPDVCTVLMEYGGLPIEPDLGTPTIRLEFPRVQVLTRGLKDDYDTPRLKAQAVLVALTAIVNQSLSGVAYKVAAALQSPFFLRRDQNDRVEIACNYQVMKAPSVS